MRTWLGMVMACLFLVGAQQAKAAPLTEDTLKAMLENLGYTVTVTGDKVPHYFKIDETAPVNDLTFTITFDLSSDKGNTVLWIYSALYEIPQGKPAPSSARCRSAAGASAATCRTSRSQSSASVVAYRRTGRICRCVDGRRTSDIWSG